MRILLLKFFYPCLALSAFINPMLGIFAFAFISIIRPECFTWGGSSIKHVFPMTLLCLVLSIVFKKQITKELFKSSYIIYFVFFYLFLFISTYLSDYTYISTSQRQLSFEFVNNILVICVYCMALFCMLSDESSTSRFITFIVGCFLFMALWGIEQRIHGNMLVEGLFGNAIGDRCAITGIFVLYFPLAIYCFETASKINIIRKYIGLGGGLFFLR